VAPPGFSRIALIGFGEVGQTLGADLLATGCRVSAFDPLFAASESPPSRALGSIPVAAAENPCAAVRAAELVISAVTAASDVDAARAVAPHLAPGTFYLDVNSVSPSTKIECAGVIGNAGGRYVEAAVMTPIAPKRIASPMLLGGLHAQEFIARARVLGFAGQPFADEIGRASAAKMCRSVIIKGVESLLCEALVAARHYGVEKVVLDSLSDLLPIGDWEKVASYMVSRALEHGARRAEEMREAAKTVAEGGLDPLMASATAEREQWAASYRDAHVLRSNLAAMLDAMRGDKRSEIAAGKAACIIFPRGHP
jgi:3-hydroxyisobutyrate dehydrogenase-like beta-hydroxyacid dehydrogenase